MPSVDEDGVRDFVERTALVLADWGVPRMQARVMLATMVTDDGVVSAHELRERLGVSAAAISGAVRYLIHAGILVREPVPGSRRDHYRLSNDLWFEATVTKSDLLMAKVAELAAEGARALGGPDTPAGARIAEMSDFFAYLQKEMPQLVDRWRASRGTD